MTNDQSGCGISGLFRVRCPHTEEKTHVITWKSVLRILCSAWLRKFFNPLIKILSVPQVIPFDWWLTA